MEQKPDFTDDSLLMLVRNRRSTRRYTSEKIDAETINKIMKIAMYAPSSYGQNPVEFVVVEDKKLLAQLAQCKSMGAPSVSKSTSTIVVMADVSQGELWVEDTSVAASYILLAAEHYGIGACWNQIHLRNGQKDSASNEIKTLLNIPSRYEVLCLIAMGNKGEKKTAKNDNDLDQAKVHFNKFITKD